MPYGTQQEFSDHLASILHKAAKLLLHVPETELLFDALTQNKAALQVGQRGVNRGCRKACLRQQPSQGQQQARRQQGLKAGHEKAGALMTTC
jgi:hypothetical protein